MKTEDFQKLQKLCEDNGFELVTESPQENEKFYVVKKKDIWDGVEFCECTESNSELYYKVGRIYKCSVINNELTINRCENNCLLKRIEDFCFEKNKGKGFNTFKPSTEEAYVEQLIKEAKDRFGEIKEGDVFIDTDGDKIRLSDKTDYRYQKENDTLWIDFVLIYEQGKWANKIERVEVKPEGGNIFGPHFYFVINDKGRDKLQKTGAWEACEHLAKCLEEYLNKS